MKTAILIILALIAIAGGLTIWRWRHYKKQRSTPERCPADLSEALERLWATYRRLSEDSAKTIKEMSEDKFLASHHHCLGRGLRNEWGLWHDSPLAQYFKAMGLHHADDMSGVILTSFHRQLTGKPIDLEDQVKHYQEYWRQMEKGRALGLAWRGKPDE